MKNRILVLFAHPAIQKSRVNCVLARAIKEIPGVTFHDLYEEYPDLQIDVKREQELLREHDIIVFQHPFYWYSAPAIVKEWYDLVLEYGFAYGEGGTALEGKRWLEVISAGGPESAYHADGYNRFNIRQLLLPVEQTAYLCGMEFMEPFVIYSSLRLDDETEIPALAQQYKRKIETLVNS